MNALQLVGLRARGWIDAGAVVYDCESTGLGSRDVAVDICVLDISGSVMFESLVQLPVGVEMGERAQQIHGIGPAQLAGAPAFPHLHEKLVGVIAGGPVVTFNADFDSRILRQTYEAWGVPWPFSQVRFECAMLLSQNAMSVRKWPRLDEAADRFGVKALGQHRARVDCETTRQVLLKIAGVI